MKCSSPALAVLLIAAYLPSGRLWAASFGDDVAFLKAYTPIIVLTDPANHAQVALAPALQGRVMTSTVGGDSGPSFGWINRELILSGQPQQHIHVFGGEDRFWMGPEGGQFSIFFSKGAPFDLEHWFTPAPLDTEPFAVVSQAPTHAEFEHSFDLTNYSATKFSVTVHRTVELLAPQVAWKDLSLRPVPAVSLVAFQSRNRIENAGASPWTEDAGLLSIWILGMFQPSPATTIVVPVQPGPEAKLGKAVNSDYFGPVPPDRLVLKDNTVFFKGDGQFRSKIGFRPVRSRNVLGSYDSAHQVLTLVQFSLGRRDAKYVNSKWELQKQPYAGDVANSYNDGPATPGAKPLGPFYEMESSSPAAALAPGNSLEHTHRTFHLTGPEAELDKIARSILGVSLKTIVSALPEAK